MSNEEFLESIRRFEELEKKYQVFSDKFNMQMPEALIDLVFEHLNELQRDKAKFKAIILPIAQKYTDEIWEEYNVANSMNYSKTEVKIFKVPKPKTREEEEKELLEELEIIPEEDREAYREIFWKSSNEFKVHKSFLFACYNKMKEVFTNIYLDDVLSLDADYLRYFDYGIYMQADNFVQEIYTECNL